MNIVIVFDSSASTAKILKCGFSDKDQVYLFPLTSKSSLIKEIEKEVQAVGCKVEILESARLINGQAEDIRDRYVHFIAELGRFNLDNDKNLKEIFAVDGQVSLWWLSLISEKNPFKSDSFNKLIQFITIVDILKEYHIDLLIYSGKCLKLMHTFENYSYRSNISFMSNQNMKQSFVSWISRFSVYYYLKHLYLLLYNFAYYYRKSGIIRKRIGNRESYGNIGLHGDEKYGIITYYPNLVEEDADKGIFSNKYFLEIQKALGIKDKNIIWIAMCVKNFQVSFEKSLIWVERFIHNGYQISFLFSYLTLRNQIKALTSMIRSGRKFLSLEKSLTKAFKMDGLNIYPLFRDDCYASFAGNVGYAGLLYYEMFRNIVPTLEIKKLLYSSEMHAWEKALITARDACRKELHLIAYQHATVSDLLVNYFADKSEISDPGSYSLPLPDIIACNGIRTANKILACGWPAEKVRVVEAIRYAYLREILGSPKTKKKDLILVIFSIDAMESSAILNMVCDAFAGLCDLEIWLKPHPFLPIDSVFTLAGRKKEEIPFPVKEGPISELLKEARIVIAGESGVSLEALSFNCDVISANVPEWVNMSPLKNVPASMVWTVNSPEELRRVALNLLTADETVLSETREREISKIINDFFCLRWDDSYPEKFMCLMNS